MKITIDIPNPPSEQRIIDVPIHFCGGQVVDAGGYGFEERKTGKWTRQNDRSKPMYGWYFCTECGSCIGDTDGVNYCSWCGAKMEAEE